MKVLVIFPTIQESAHFCCEGVYVEYCGVGLVASAYNTLKAILKHSPDVVVMGGIAGVYSHSNLKIGDSVLVSQERIADLGYFDQSGFRQFTSTKFNTRSYFDSPYLDKPLPFRAVVSNSMNSSTSPFVECKGVDVENMEGGAFFYVCLGEGVKFYELRTISNVVDSKRECWDFNTSINNLGRDLKQLIEYLRDETDN